MKKISRIIFFIISGLILISPKIQAQPKVFSYKPFIPFKMIFLPDTHVSFREEDDWILYKESLVIFQDILRNIKAVPELNFVVFGGDSIENDDKALSDLPLYLDNIDETAFSYYAILGDREADLKAPYTKQDFCAEYRSHGFENPELTYWLQHPEDNVLLIGLDTSVENKFEGKLPPEELFWLDNVLKSNTDKFTVITMHHPAFLSTSADGTVWKKFILENSKEFLNIINKYPQVKLVLSGHHHNYAVKNLNGKLFISLPSAVTYPNEYKILKISSDKVEVENKEISFKQITKKAKNIIVKTSYAKEFNPKKSEKILDFQKGDKISKTKVFYF